jgi:prepilin-type N-terminal cleavage/methylation domain-containing protein
MTSLMRDNRGYSLIELLISVLLMTIVMGVAARALRDAMRTDEAIGIMADVNQNMQSASTMMVRDFIDAGRNVRIGGLTLPDGPAPDVVRPGPPGVAAASWPTPAVLYAVTPWNELGPKINNNTTDAVTIVSVDDRVNIADSTSTLTAGSSITVTMYSGGANGLNTNTANTIGVGDLMWVSRSSKTAVLYVTAVNKADNKFTAATVGDPSGFNQQNATSGSMAQIGSSPAPDAAFPTKHKDTAVRRIRMITYWVEEKGGLPYLMRQENYRTPVEVGLGVENLELQYDLFANGAMRRVSDPFNIAELDPAGSPNQFDKAHIVLAVRSDRKFAQTKGYLRNDLTTQVSLRSLQVQQNFR